MNFLNGFGGMFNGNGCDCCSIFFLLMLLNCFCGNNECHGGGNGGMDCCSLIFLLMLLNCFCGNNGFGGCNKLS